MLTTVLALALAASAAPKATSIEVPLPPGELRGQVLGPNGAPIRSFSVNNVKFDDAEGRFKVLTPPQGEFRVVVRADGFAPNVFSVVGASGKKLQIPEIRLGPGEHALGEVLDAVTGLPVRDARATLADPAKLERLRLVRPERVGPIGTTGKGGWFELRHAPRGLLVLVVSHPDYLTEYVAVNTREPLPTVLLHRGGAISGTVKDARGAPLPLSRVVALAWDGRDAAETLAGPGGVFKLEHLRPGSYRVVAMPRSGAPGTVQAEVEDQKETPVSVLAGSTRGDRVALTRDRFALR
jgi:hypothetical protein